MSSLGYYAVMTYNLLSSLLLELLDHEDSGATPLRNLGKY